MPSARVPRGASGTRTYVGGNALCCQNVRKAGIGHGWEEVRPVRARDRERPVSGGGIAGAYANHELAVRAARVMPRGNTRTTLFVPPSPPYAVRGEGCWVADQLGHRVIDCNNNYTSLIHGHAFPATLDAAREQLPLGTAFGLPTASEVELAEHLAARTTLPQWRFSNSGTEAVMTAVRAARAATGRDLVVRFDGSYHGTYDAVVSAPAAGVPDAVAAMSVALPQGDMSAFDRVVEERGAEIAVVVMDLMPNRAGLVPADPAFVAHLREATSRIGALLLIDEVITFRLAEGGMHTTYGVTPDLVTMGKVIGGGFPVGAVGGSAEVMSVFDPARLGAVSWGGTFSANPVSMAAGLAALREFGAAQIERINRLGDTLRERLAEAGVAVSGQGSLLRITERVDLAALWWELYGAGVLAGTNGLLALSTPMSEQELGQVERAVITAVRRVKNAG